MVGFGKKSNFTNLKVRKTYLCDDRISISSSNKNKKIREISKIVKNLLEIFLNSEDYYLIILMREGKTVINKLKIIPIYSHSISP